MNAWESTFGEIKKTHEPYTSQFFQCSHPSWVGNTDDSDRRHHVTYLAPGRRGAGPGFQVTVNKTRVITLSRATGQISVGNPGVADIRLLTPTHLYVLGTTLGTTNVTLGSKASGF